MPFSLPWQSSLLKLPIIVIQKFCYHGNTTSHFSPLLTQFFTIFILINQMCFSVHRFPDENYILLPTTCSQHYA